VSESSPLLTAVLNRKSKQLSQQKRSLTSYGSDTVTTTVTTVTTVLAWPHRLIPTGSELSLGGWVVAATVTVIMSLALRTVTGVSNCWKCGCGSKGLSQHDFQAQGLAPADHHSIAHSVTAAELHASDDK